MWARSWIGCTLVAFWFSGCVFSFDASTPPSVTDEVWDDGMYAIGLDDAGMYRDGTYTGHRDLPTPQFIVVDVTIENRRIVAIHLRQHPFWKTPQEQEQLFQVVIKDQTTATIAPRHEESEQDQLLDAIDDALNKARQVSPSDTAE
jgi:uncharacterized protein with FMN-binding domain